MTQAKAIKAHCLECSAGSNREVTLCVIPECQLYPFRFGCGNKSSTYKRRIDAAKKNYADDIREMVALGYDLPEFASKSGPQLNPTSKKWASANEEARE